MQKSPKLSPNSVTFRLISPTSMAMGPPTAVNVSDDAGEGVATNWTPVEGTGLGSVTSKGMSTTAPNWSGYGYGTWIGSCRCPPDWRWGAGIGPSKPDTPVVSRNIDASPVIWVSPRFSACWATACGIENWVCRLASWNCWPWDSVEGEIDAVVVVSFRTRSPTGLPGQYIS